MCGIAGVSLIKSQKATAKHLAPLLAALAHRGPDGEGTFTHASLGLAHRRLSIIDISGGRQPLVAGKTAIVVNGEIYNYKALQTLATQNGARLHTASDSEPPLHRFTQIGEGALEELQGMYALALADGATETLYLATDPFGIKPLYYAETNLGFIFASEPKAILAAGWVRAEPNLTVLPQLLNRHYSTGSQTLFKNIHRLLPGERLTVRHGKIIMRRRKLPPLNPVTNNESRITNHDFNEQLTAAVSRHLQADVPYGILLSGGLDSTAVTLAMRSLGAPVHAYTARIMVAGGVNEADIAASFAQSIGATHTTVPYDESDFWPMLPKLAWAMDDLATDYAALPLLKLTARAREDVKILLSGEGGDEMLAGYPAYRKKPNLLSYFKARRSGDAAPFQSLFQINVSTPPPPEQPWPTRGLTKLQSRQGQDVAGWLPNDLLLKLDRTTMAHGIEGRVPYLDDTFAAWAFSLPDEFKVRPDAGKLILRQHLAAQGQSQLAWARKQGFSVAVGSFLAHKKERLAALWQTSPILTQILHPHAAEKLLGNLAHAKSANLALSLTLLAFWHAIHVQGQSWQTLSEEWHR
ncbi:MAG: asparagine synthase (glutamine-hydrolyzing) [Proteobacteria bacterium]|nr:asparagine synthase (glutamine-hydrolyzing) [Pseudomonadota bacterium]